MTSSTPRAWPFALLPLALIFLALMCAGVLVEPPPVRTSNAAAQFDATAARARLARVLGDEAPHPIDSAAQDAVRERLLAEIRAIGYAPELHEAFTCRAQPRSPTVDCAYARNIVFSAGPESGPAVLAATHYDSVPAAPGASDAGIGMAVWLEIARMIRQAPLERRVIFLISDGEEVALLGANEFARNDPLMEDVQALVNLEARGTRGPAIFFESNPPNADALAAFSGAPRPVANSVMAAAYRFMPNSTDVSAMTRPGLDIINIALLDGLEDYHTPNDSLASQDPRSVQHMGDMALHALRNFAGGPDRGDPGETVYTDIAARILIAIPAMAAQIVIGLGALIALFIWWRESSVGRWRAFAAPPLAIVLGGLLGAGVGYAMLALRGAEYWFAHPEPTRAWSALAALFGGVLALMLTRARNAAQAEAAGAAWFALLGLAFSLVASGISILFVPPLALYAVGALVSLAWKPARAIGGGLALVAALLVWTPALYLTELALSFDIPFVFPLLIALTLLTGLGVLVNAQGPARWRGALAVLGVALIASLAAAFLSPTASAARPAPLNVNLFVDTDTGETRLVAGGAGRALPPEVAGLAAFEAALVLPGDRFPSWTAPVDAETPAAPAITDLNTVDEGERRIVRGRFLANGVYRVVLRIPRAAAPVSATLNGVTTSFADTGGVSDYVNLACQGRACDGAVFEIVLEAGEAGSGDWYLIGQTSSRASVAADPVRAARPETVVPIQNGDATITLSRVNTEN
jgi:hypothetical protein